MNKTRPLGLCTVLFFSGLGARDIEHSITLARHDNEDLWRPQGGQVSMKESPSLTLLCIFPHPRARLERERGKGEVYSLDAREINIPIA